jgi:hypothetical protein
VVGELLLVNVFGGLVGKHCRRRQANSLASGALHQALEPGAQVPGEFMQPHVLREKSVTWAAAAKDRASPSP